MTYMAPCHDCLIKRGCDLREDFRQRIAGLGARSVRFKCSILDRELRMGRRVQVRMTLPDEERWSPSPYYDHDGSWRERVVSGTLLSGPTRDYRFGFLIDADALSDEEWTEAQAGLRNPEKVRTRSRLRHSRIVSFLDEPDRSEAEIEAFFRNARRAA